MKLRRKGSLVALAAMAAALAVTPVWSAPGGGGGGGDMSAPSGPSIDPVAEYQKGITAYQAQDFKGAAKAFKRVVGVISTHAPAQYLLGSSFMQLGEFKKAKRPLEQALRHDPAMIDAQRDLAVTYAKLGDMPKATEQRTALSTRLTACATACPDAAKLDGAVKAVDAAMAGTPPQALGPSLRFAPRASSDALYVSAVSKINEHHYEAAIAELNDSLWSAGPHPDVLTYLGFANRKLKRYDKAREWYEAALTIAPNHLGAIEYYGELKLEMGDAAGARRHLARLDALCAFGCQQADELRRWIGKADKSAS
jgi:tetratricopeptide (TPR) repeat protein